MHPDNLPFSPRTSSLLRAIVAVLLLILPAADARAQELPPIRPSYGLSDTQFVVMAISQTHAGSLAQGDSLWLLLDALGIDVVEQYPIYRDTIERYALATSALRKPWQRLISKFEPLEAGHGFEIQLYPFTQVDTVQSPYFASKFLYRRGGDTARNRSPKHRGLLEQVYDSANTTPGQLIDSGLAFDWRPGAVERRQIAAGELLAWARNTGSERPPFHIVAVGHTFPGGNSAPGDSLFRIELYQEILAGQRVLATPDTRRTFRRDTLVPLRTFFVTRRDLAGSAGRGGSADDYREVAFSDSLLRRPDGAPGPFHPAQPPEGSRLELKVYWLGGERVALRSINIRDRIGERVLGAGRESIAYRERIVRSAFRDLYGTATPAPGDTIRRAWLRLYTGDEPNVIEGAAYAYLDTMLRRRFTAINPADSLPLFTGQIGAQAIKNFIHRALPEEIVPEMYSGWKQDSSRRFGVPRDAAPSGRTLPQLQYRLELPHHALPRFREHNGGRFHIPLLLALDSVRLGLYTDILLRPRIEAYELSVQRGKLGWYQFDEIGYPYNTLPLHMLTIGAELARERGRRLIATVGGNGYIGIRARPGDTVPDTTVLLVSPPEIRVMTNLGLCYGARGVRYNVLGDYRNFLFPDPATGLYLGEMDNFGLMGPRLGDTAQDLFVAGSPNAFSLTDNVDSTHRVDFDTLYLGYRAHTRELKSLNTWLHRIGPELCRLRWRTAYSIHMAGKVTGSIDAGIAPRPLPAGEIVASVRSRDRYSGAFDPDTATFVELGMFYPGTGLAGASGDAPADTNHIFLVNRRTFEAPDTLRQDPAYGLLHALSGTRAIAVRFNLRRPGGGEFLRVTEIEPDRTPLPGERAERPGLDTVVHIDSLVELTLRPGGGALLRITRVMPGDTLGDAMIDGGHGMSKPDGGGAMRWRHMAGETVAIDRCRDMTRAWAGAGIRRRFIHVVAGGRPRVPDALSVMAHPGVRLVVDRLLDA